MEKNSQNCEKITHCPRRAQEAKLFLLQRISLHGAKTFFNFYFSRSFFLQNLDRKTHLSLSETSPHLMEIPQKLLKFKFHILFALTLCVVVSSLIVVAPRFVTILAYFWPLFLSTALFLVAVVVFGKTSLPATEAHGDKAGEGLLDFVAGQPEHAVESFKYE